MSECHACGCKDEPIGLGFCHYHYHKIRELDYPRKYFQKYRIKMTEYRRKYRQTKKGKEATLRAIKKYETSHPKRKFAWIKAQKIPSEPCIKCGAIKVHKHHPDVMKPLKVISLCPLHHKQVHML